MQVTETLNEGLKREYRVVIPRKDLEGKLDERLRSLSQTVTMRGFRPGKVPMTLLRRQYGRTLLNEIVQETVNESAQSAITDHGVRPALQPNVEEMTFAEGADLEYRLSVEALPEIGTVDLGAVALERPKAEVTDEAVEKAIAELAQRSRTFEKVDRVAADQDSLLIDFLGKVDGVPFAGGEAKDFVLELGANMLIPGFEAPLLGRSAGEQVTVAATFPADYGNKDLADKPATFDVTIKEVRAARVPAVDDALAKTLGLEDRSALAAKVKEQLQQQYGMVSRARAKRALLDALAATQTFAVPAGMVEREFEDIWRQVSTMANPDGAAAPAVEGAVPAAAAPSTPEQEKARAEYRLIAERRVRLGLLLSEIGRANNITVEPAEVNRAITARARQFPGQEKQVVEFYKKTPQATASLTAPIFEDKVVDFILEVAKVTDRIVPAEELFKEPDDDLSAPAAAG
ncbi:MAG: trigger factor [Alphaproteobacteria bacterium]|nr:trigger factor [Alphaproteobacteria bacterium]